MNYSPPLGSEGCGYFFRDGVRLLFSDFVGSLLRFCGPVFFSSSVSAVWCLPPSPLQWCGPLLSSFKRLVLSHSGGGFWCWVWAFVLEVGFESSFLGPTLGLSFGGLTSLLQELDPPYRFEAFPTFSSKCFGAAACLSVLVLAL